MDYIYKGVLIVLIVFGLAVTVQYQPTVEYLGYTAIAFLFGGGILFLNYKKFSKKETFKAFDASDDYEDEALELDQNDKTL